MSSPVIRDLKEVSPSWLTDVLTAKGALDRGDVEHVEMTSDERDLSVVARLKLSYSGDATGDCPEQLFIKLVEGESEHGLFGPSEVEYYSQDYVDVSDAPIPTCYDAAFSSDLNRYHILIEDHSETHLNGFKGVFGSLRLKC